MRSFEWTDQIVGRLEELLRDGLTGSQIATELGTTRNAVIGKVYRTPYLNQIGLGGGIGGRPSKLAQAADRRHKARRAKQPPRAPRKKPVAVLTFEPVPLNLTLTELGPRNCRWPVNDAAIGEDHLFCGKEAEECQPYCTHHARRAHGPGTESERSATRMAIHLGRAA